MQQILTGVNIDSSQFQFELSLADHGDISSGNIYPGDISPIVTGMIWIKIKTFHNYPGDISPGKICLGFLKHKIFWSNIFLTQLFFRPKIYSGLRSMIFFCTFFKLKNFFLQYPISRGWGWRLVVVQIRNCQNPT